jgi:hypothetical protein
MAFPSNNAKSVSRLVMSSAVATATGILERILTGQAGNLFSVPGVVDVSGMEFSVGVLMDSGSGTKGIEASTADTSRLEVTFEDGGASGDNATAAQLFSASTLSSTTAWVAYVPKDAAGTTATDLDADDWVNFLIASNATTVPGIGVAEVAVGYIFGKPGVIN